MNKYLFLPFLLVALVAMVGCSTQKQTIAGAETVVSLAVSPEQYTMRRLPEVTAKGNSFWGIPSTPKGKKEGLVLSVNGVKIDRGSKVLPAMSLIGMSLVSGVLVNQYVLTTPVFGNQKGVGDYLLSSAISLPVAGAINNLLWQNSGYKVAMAQVHSTLLANHPKVDAFINPRYEVHSNMGLWTQSVSVNARMVGATYNDENSSAQHQQTVYQEAEVAAAPQMATADSVSVAQVLVSPEEARLRQSNYFKKGDRVRFKVNLNTRTKKGQVEIPEGVVYNIKRDNVYIEYTYENRKRRAVKNFKELSYAYSQILENYPMNSKGERILHFYKPGDEVSFKARVLIPDVKGNFDIPKGTVIGIDGNVLIIEFSFLRYTLTQRKHFSEVVLVRKNDQ